MSLSKPATQPAEPQSSELTSSLLAAAHQHLIRFHALDDEPPILSRGKGSLVWDVDGKEYVDFVSGQICATLGHNHPAVVRAIEEACAKKIHANDFMLSEDSILLARSLAAMLPESLAKLMFKSTGSEANEAAVYMAKLAGGGFEIVGIQRSFHGMTAIARGATYSYGTKGHGPGMPGRHMLPAPYAYRCPVRHCQGSCDCTCLDVGFEAFDAASEGYGAAVIVEPILSAGGLIDPPPTWFQELARRTRERGMFLILDEAQTAPGRLGAMFGFEQLGIVPDFLSISKCIGGGIPLSAVATSSDIEQRCFDAGFVMGSSHTNDPLPARVGLAVLRVLVEDDLPARAARQGARLRAALEALAERYELIGDIRGRGLLQGFELVLDRGSKRPAERAGAVFARACLERGLIANIVRMRGEMSICRLAPPLTISDDELDRGIAIMDEALALATEAAAGASGTA